MADKYIFLLRRGTRYTDENGATLYDDDGNVVRDDWATYTSLADHINPLDGELVVEFEQVYNQETGELGKVMPRFKIGYGDAEFANLDYISPDSFILPTQATVTIYPNKWMRVDNDGKIIDANGNVVDTAGNIVSEGYYELDENGEIIDSDSFIENRYVQFVNVVNASITPNSKVDIQPSPSDLVVFSAKDISFTTVNANRHVRVCVIGQKPSSQYTFDATVTEVVETNEPREVVGNTITTPPPQSDWEQKNPASAGYIKNKPDVDALIERIKALEDIVGALTATIQNSAISN